MGLFDWLNVNRKKEAPLKNNWVQIDDDGNLFYHVNNLLSPNKIIKFNNYNSLLIANSLSEIYIPIDFIAERVAGVEYKIRNKKTLLEVENLPIALKNLIERPNYLHSFSEIVYQIVFTELACGGSYTVSKVPETFKGKSYDRISNIFVLNPDLTEPNLMRTIPNPLSATELSELVEYYKTYFLVDLKTTTEETYYNSIGKVDDVLRPVSPLMSVEKNINNLLAVYSARFNVYEKNGMAGVVYRDDNGQSNNLLEATNPVTRKEILEDLRSKEGITGNKQFTGISQYKLGFLDTLGKIKDLEPFAETEADALAIGTIYGIDKEMLAYAKGTTFTNKRDAEKNIWNSKIIPYSKDVAKTLTEVFYLPKEWEFYPDFSSVAILQADRKTEVEADKIELENIEKLQNMGVDQTNKLEKWKV